MSPFLSLARGLRRVGCAIHTADASFLLPLGDRSLRHSLTLTFYDGELEQAWLNDQRPVQVQRLRYAAAATVVLLMLSTLRDLLIPYEGRWAIVAFRATGLVPTTIVPGLLTYTMWGTRHARNILLISQCLLAVACAAAGALVVPEKLFHELGLIFLPIITTVFLLFPVGMRRTGTVVFLFNAIFLLVWVPSDIEPFRKLLTLYALYGTQVPILLASWLAEGQARDAWLAERRLAEEQARHEALLHRILPRQIAARLLAGESPIADRLPSVTVLFADIVGFTEFASGVPAHDLVQRLDEAFSRMDAVVAAHGFTKIKTVGDAYMAVGGLPWDGLEDHVRMGAKLALALRETPAKEALMVRIGLNTGPAVAGVIGKERFAYDIWGDAVNVASRMESTGRGGQVHVSAAFVDALGDEASVTSRGVREVKGKGEMETFWLDGF